MKKIYLDNTDLILNCILNINLNTNRRTIDAIDLQNYKCNLINKAQEKNVELLIIYEDSEDKFKNYIKQLKPGIFTLLPWIYSTELVYKYLGCFSLELQQLLEDEFLIENDKERINNLANLETDFYEKLNKSITNNTMMYRDLKIGKQKVYK